MVQTEKYGTYHATNEGICSWAEFAEEIFRQTSKIVSVKRISSKDYIRKATRPYNSRLSKESLVNNGFYKLPHWKEALTNYLREMELINS